MARASEAGRPSKRAWYRSNRLVELDQKVAAPLAGGRRNAAGGEDLRRSSRHQGEMENPEAK
jgi:hypothetical protein